MFVLLPFFIVVFFFMPFVLDMGFFFICFLVESWVVFVESCWGTSTAEADKQNAAIVKIIRNFFMGLHLSMSDWGLLVKQQPVYTSVSLIILLRINLLTRCLYVLHSDYT